MGVAPHGAMWIIGADGLTRFDIDESDQALTTVFLRGTGLTALEVAPDGSVWVQGGPETGDALFVIPGDGAMATE
jgi:hypothetical protein